MENEEQIKRANQIVDDYVRFCSAPWKNLIFTESGTMRLSWVMGWLYGLKQSAKLEDDIETAKRLIVEFVERMDYFNNYGGVGLNKLPHFRVKLGDAGTFAGFAVTWYSATDNQDGDYVLALGEGSSPTRQGYAPWINGAMIYRGPQLGKEFKVGEYAWSVHT